MKEKDTANRQKTIPAKIIVAEYHPAKVHRSKRIAGKRSKRITNVNDTVAKYSESLEVKCPIVICDRETTDKNNATANYEQLICEIESETYCQNILEKLSVAQEKEKPQDTLVECSETPKVENVLVICDRETANKNDATANHEEIMYEVNTETYCQKTLEKLFVAEEKEKPNDTESNKHMICDFCDQRYAEKSVLSRHMIKVHLNRKVKQFLCDICNKSFTRRFSLKRHQAYTHGENESWNCPQCVKIFARRDYLIKHVQETHEKIQGDRFKCEICFKIFTRLYALKRHRADIHDSPKVSICSWCGKTFSRKFNLSRHVQVVHLDALGTEFICFHCDRTYTKKHRLLFHIKKRHLELGNDVKQIKCPQCPKIFVSQFNLSRHINTVHEKIKSFECYYCSRMFSFQHNLKRHVTSVHLIKNDPDDKSVTAKENHVCSMCNKTFSRHYELLCHIRRLHSLAEDKPYICNFCDGRFPCRRTISTHIRKRHQLGAASKIFCCLCKKPCETSRNALDHYVVGHNISMEYEYPQFSSFVAFKEWMMKMEKATLCRYVKSKMYKCETDTRYVFLCHRSGFYQSKSSDRKRQMKKCGPKKLNGFCPAHIRVVCNNNDSSCQVTFLKTHVGHDAGDENELQHIYLTEDERKGLAAKISAGIPLPRILKECHLLAQESEIYKKFRTLRIRDLHNISVAYHLKQSRGNLFAEPLCNAFLERNTDAVLFYKQQWNPDNIYRVFEDNDVVLIVMTEFQQTTLKSHAHRAVAIYSNGTGIGNFFLHVLLVLDGNNNGIVAAFALSNRNDESLIDIFLTCLKSRVGCIETNILVTCIDDFYCNSWMKIMNIPQYRLYCMRCLKKDWWQNLNKISDNVKQKLMRQHLHILSCETDEILFLKKLNDLIENEDPDVQKFIEYFKTSYLPNVRYWAYYYRQNSGFDVVTKAFDKVMKYVLGSDKKMRRPAHCLCSITDFISLMKCDYQLKEILEKEKVKWRLLKRAHIRAIEHLEQAGVTLEMIDDKTCRIALLNGSTTHMIEKISSANCSSALKTCQLLCKECRACFHQYACTCEDYVINRNMCLHIHVLCIFFNNSDDPFSSLIRNSPECSNTCLYEVEDYSHSSVPNVSPEVAFVDVEENYRPVTYQTISDDDTLSSSENGTSRLVNIPSVAIVPKVNKGEELDETQRLIDEFKNFITKKSNNLSNINVIRSNFSKLLSPVIIEQKSE